jgi:hypothetical protein
MSPFLTKKTATKNEMLKRGHFLPKKCMADTKCTYRHAMPGASCRWQQGAWDLIAVGALLIACGHACIMGDALFDRRLSLLAKVVLGIPLGCALLVPWIASALYVRWEGRHRHERERCMAQRMREIEGERAIRRLERRRERKRGQRRRRKEQPKKFLFTR